MPLPLPDPIKPPAAAPKRRGYGGRSAETLALERRRRLLDAGLELFATRGYTRTPIELICTTAGVTARHFYEAFPSREALLRAVYEGVVEHARQSLLTVLTTAESPPEVRLNQAIRAFVHAYTDDRRCARIACIEVVGVSAAMAQRRSEIINLFAAMIETYVNSLANSGLLPKRSYHLSAVAMVGAANELMAKWLVEADAPDVAALTEELTLLFAALLTGFRVISGTADSPAGNRR